MKTITTEEFLSLKTKGKQFRFTGVVVSETMGWKRHYLKGKLHRTDGPALETHGGHSEWWWFGNFICMSDLIYTTPDIHSEFIKTRKLANDEYVELEIVKGTVYPEIDQIYFRKVLCDDGVFYIPILPGM